MKHRFFKLAIALIICMPIVGSAIEVDLSEIGFPVEKVEVHGWFSQGYMKSSENNVYVGTRDGTSDLREYGVNFSGNLTDEIFLAAQLMAYNLGGQGGDEIFLHYGLADYTVSNNFGIRAGRLRIPMGLYNETRDIDMLRTSVFLPQNIYSDYYRDYYSGMDGASIYGNVDFGDWGFLSYQAGIGKPITNNSEKGDFPYNFAVFADGVKDLTYKNTHSANFQLNYETPLDGLRLGYTWRRLDVELNGQVWYPPFSIWVTGPTVYLENYINQVASAEYQTGKLTLMAEAVVRTNGGTKQNQGWYGGFNYELTDALSAGMYYSEYVVTDESTEFMATDQKTISLFSRYNITDSWLVKAQVDFNDGNGNAQFPAKKSAGLGEDSVLFSVKTTWSF